MGGALTDHDYDYGLNQRVQTDEGEGVVIGRTKFGFPEGAYLIQLSEEQRWMYRDEMSAASPVAQ